MLKMEYCLIIDFRKSGATECAGLENTRPSYRGGGSETGKRGTIIQVGGKRETSSYGTPMVPVL